MNNQKLSDEILNYITDMDNSGPYQPIEILKESLISAPPGVPKEYLKAIKKVIKLREEYGF